MDQSNAQRSVANAKPYGTHCQQQRQNTDRKGARQQNRHPVCVGAVKGQAGERMIRRRADAIGKTMVSAATSMLSSIPGQLLWIARTTEKSRTDQPSGENDFGQAYTTLSPPKPPSAMRSIGTRIQAHSRTTPTTSTRA